MKYILILMLMFSFTFALDACPKGDYTKSNNDGSCFSPSEMLEDVRINYVEPVYTQPIDNTYKMTNNDLRLVDKVFLMFKKSDNKPRLYKIFTLLSRKMANSSSIYGFELLP